MTTREANAVANFLASLDGLTMHEAYENARHDRRLYNWSDEAMTAIVDGIGAAKLPIDSTAAQFRRFVRAHR